MNLLVDAGSSLSKGALHELTLGEPGSQEDGIDSQEDPGTLAECKSREKEAEPKENLERSDQHHGGVIVLLDKLADGIGKRRLGLGSARRRWSAAWCDLGRLNRGNEIGTSVGRNVEDRVDGEREQSERDLSGEQPDQAYYFNSCQILESIAQLEPHSRRYCTFSSDSKRRAVEPILAPGFTRAR